MVLSSAIVCDHDRRIADDRRSSFHMIADDRRPYCDLRSAICDPRSYGNQPLDRTWFYLLRSSAITIAGSQTIADLIAICDHMETSLYRGRQRNVPKCKTHVQSDCFCSLSFLCCGVVVAVAVLFS